MRVFLLAFFGLMSCRLPASFSYKQEKTSYQYRLPESDCRAEKYKYTSGSTVYFTIKNNCSYEGIELSRKDAISYSLSTKKILSLRAGNSWGSIVRGITAWEATFYSDGSPQQLVFRYPQRIEGILWRQVTFSSDGKLAQGISAEEVEVKGVWLRAGTVLYQTPEGKLRADSYALSRDQYLQGIWWAAGQTLSFSPDGKILSGILTDKGATINGLSLKGRSTVNISAAGQVLSATLDVPQTIQGMSLSGPVSFYESGLLQASTLEKDALFNDLLIPAQTNVRFSADGKLSSAVNSSAQETTLAGVTCPKGDFFYFDHTLLKMPLCVSSPADVILNNAGKLQSVTLSTDQLIQGVLYAESHAIRFSPEGKVSSGRLAQDKTIDGQPLPKGATFYLDEKGSLLSFIVALEKEMTLLGVTCHTEDILVGYRPPKKGLSALCAASVPSVHENGAIHYFALLQPLIVQGIPLQESDLSFHPNGQLHTSYLSKNTTIQGVVARKESLVSFFEDGKLQLVTLAEPQLLQKILFEGEIELHPNGKVAYGVLSRAAIIEGQRFEAGDDVSLDEEGKLVVSKPVVPPDPTPKEKF